MLEFAAVICENVTYVEGVHTTRLQSQSHHVFPAEGFRKCLKTSTQIKKRTARWRALL